MKKLLAILAHPDDEGAFAGTLAHYAQNDTEVTLICATKGEEGEISDPALATSENLAEVRTAELEAACEVIGIKQFLFLGYRDSGMEGTPPNEDPRSLAQADPTEAVGRIVALMRQLQPDVVVTFEPFGWYGHPDHIAVYKHVTEAYKQVSNMVTYPEAGPAWQPQRLFYSVLPASEFQIIADYAQANGLDAFQDFEIQDFQRETEAQITHVLDMAHLMETKQQAMAVHQTQFGEDSIFRQLPTEIVRQAWGSECFIQIEPAPDEALRAQPATDLFVDL